MSKLNHKNIVKFVELLATKKSLFIVTEMCRMSVYKVYGKNYIVFNYSSNSKSHQSELFHSYNNFKSNDFDRYNCQYKFMILYTPLNQSKKY